MLVSKTPVKFSNDRTKWTHYGSIEDIVDRVYHTMAECGVAEIVPNEFETIVIEATGEVIKKQKYRLTHPERTIYVDEMGSNTNMKERGNRKQTRVLVEPSSEAKQDCSTSNNKFTVMGFSTGEGKPLLCALILECERRKLPFHVIQGFDIFADVVGSEEE